MPTSIIQQRLTAYYEWKTRASLALSELESWLESKGRTTEANRESIRHALDTLDKDRLSIAFLAEHARGKTELINAIFFAEYGRHLLPSATGNATSCPTELLWDRARNEAYLRLLPIETRSRDIPIARLKRAPEQWVHYPLPVQDPEQMSSTLREMLQTKKVSMAETTRLRLSAFVPKPEGQPAADQVEIPKWRHAIISFPHPLLVQGLVILDTPGLNGLGSEPELSESMLPAAETVLFVLAADKGLTFNDLQAWKRYLKGFQAGRRRSIVVALNKIDLLWNERRETQETDARLAKQQVHAAKALAISKSAVFPVSAQKALLAKIQSDAALLNRSSMPALESHLSSRMVETKHRALTEALDIDVGPLLKHNRKHISSLIDQTKAQLAELEQLREKNHEVIEHLLKRTREEQELYLKSVHQFQVSRADLLEGIRVDRQALDQDNIASVVDAALREMAQSWTTRGLSSVMKSLFDELQHTMHVLSSNCERIRKGLNLTYRRYKEEFGFDVTPPEVFIATEFRAEFELLRQELEIFRHSPAIALAERGSAIKRFRQHMVRRALVLFDQLRAAYDAWIRNALQPLAKQIQEHKLTMEKRLEDLQRIGRSKDALQTRINELQKQQFELTRQLTALRNIHNALLYDPTVDEQGNGNLHLVAG